MSNTRRLRPPRPQNPASAILTALDGAHIPGGCDHCNAYQRIRACHDGPDAHRITICHDDLCPWWTARQEQSA